VLRYPATGTQLGDQGFIQAAGMAKVDILQDRRLAQAGLTETGLHAAVVSVGHFPIDEQTQAFLKGQGVNLRTDEKEIQVLTPDQIRAFLETGEDQKYSTLLLLSVMTGARQGELLGLKWSDLDMESSQLHIQRTFNHGQFFPPKSKASNRKIDLAPVVVHQLRKWKLACPRTSLNLMFPNEAGNPINCRNLVQRYFIPALEKAGIIEIETTKKKLKNSKKNKYIKKVKGRSDFTT
jgi:integrase